MSIPTSMDVLLAPFLFTAISFSIFLLCCGIFMCTRNADFEHDWSSRYSSLNAAYMTTGPCYCQPNKHLVVIPPTHNNGRIAGENFVPEKTKRSKSFLDFMTIVCGNQRRRERKVEDRSSAASTFLTTPSISDEECEPEVLL